MITIRYATDAMEVMSLSLLSLPGTPNLTIMMETIMIRIIIIIMIIL
jgi:hypothetical protein